MWAHSFICRPPTTFGWARPASISSVTRLGSAIAGAQPSTAQPAIVARWSTLGGPMPPAWLDPSELRIGLGCMRLSTEDGFDPEVAVATIIAAATAGVTVFDTARSYGRGASGLGQNESLLA